MSDNRFTTEPNLRGLAEENGMLLLIDNYDSFVHNLARYCRELGCSVEVVRNDAVTVEQVRSLRPQGIILSPGPCAPETAGICIELVSALWQTVPILGVCLGHQAIAAAFGARIVRAPRPVHGHTSAIDHDATGIFEGLNSPLPVMRYHSLIVDESTLPAALSVTARTTDGIPMAIAHASAPVLGVQFHPESILTESGHRLLGNFLAMAGLSGEPCQTSELSADVVRSLWLQEFESGLSVRRGQ